VAEEVVTLSDDEIEARLAGLNLEEEGEKYKFFRPTSEAVDKWITYAQGSHDCFYTGLQAIDEKMRGVWPSDVLVVTGRAHSGKSAVLLSSIARNLQEDPDFYSVIYTPDEPEVLVVAKLYALLYRRNLAQVEEALRLEDRDIISEIQEAKEGFLDRIKIFPTALSFDDMSEAMRECEDYWQHKPRFVMVDFLEQLPKASGYEGVSNVLKGMKEWAEVENLPVGLIHQSGKQSHRGSSDGMNSGKYNADEYAIQQLNVFRKRDNPKLSDEERRTHSVSVSLDLCKNKRPPCKVTNPPIDYFMDPDCGFVREYYESDVPEDDRWLE
jgi:replicative DNA helicase